MHPSRGELPLPHQSDSPEHPNTLPQPNLNPLLNPILAKNIGRWAEVYFTNPPEQREHAVQELVRELEREGPIPERAEIPQPTPRQRDLELDKTLTYPTAEVPAQGITCPSCGYVNRPKHKFCGRCGVRIALPNVGVMQEQEPKADTVCLQNSEHPESPIFGLESTPRWRPYRLYAGVALALAVLVIGYMAWHSSQTTSGPSHFVSQAPPAETSPVSPTPPPSSPEAAAPFRTPPAATKPEGPPSQKTAPLPAEATAEIDPASANPPIPAPTSGENGFGSSSAAGTGSEELAMARNFLNGTNRSQAVPWLWKAVARQNVEATVLLSGLYLRGDGVPKNCEQARLLLDAAAVKKRKDAAELLRNMRAFGCE